MINIEVECAFCQSKREITLRTKKGSCGRIVVESLLIPVFCFDCNKHYCAILNDYKVEFITSVSKDPEETARSIINRLKFKGYSLPSKDEEISFNETALLEVADLYKDLSVAVRCLNKNAQNKELNQVFSKSTVIPIDSPLKVLPGPIIYSFETPCV